MEILSRGMTTDRFEDGVYPRLRPNLSLYLFLIPIYLQLSLTAHRKPEARLSREASQGTAKDRTLHKARV